MAIYTINELAKLSGIKAHTIRIWEKRYNLFCPDRTYNNSRYYKDCELELLLNIAFLIQHGHRISKLSTMSPEQLDLLVSNLKEDLIGLESVTDRVVKAILDFDEDRIRDLIGDYMDQNGIYDTLDDIISPIIDRLHLLCLTNKINSSHEVFYYNILKRIFTSLAESNRPSKCETCCHYLLLPVVSSKQHFGVPLLHYVLNQKNVRCTEMGYGTEMNDLPHVLLSLKPDAVVSVIKHKMTKNEFIDLVDTIASVTSKTRFYLINDFPLETTSKFPSHVKCFPDIHTFSEYIDSRVLVPIK